MPNRSLLHLAIALVTISPRVAGAAMLTCADVFESARLSSSASSTPTVHSGSSSVLRKFRSPGHHGHFLQLVDQKVGTLVKAYVRTARLAGVEAEQADRYFETLAARGLSLEAPEETSQEKDDLESPDVVMIGTADLVLAALRHSAIESIHSIEASGETGKVWLVSKAPVANYQYFADQLPGRKFESETLHIKFRAALFMRAGTEQSLSVVTIPVDRSSEAFQTFSKDLLELGVRAVQTAAVGPVVQQVASDETSSKAKLQITLFGPIDALYGIIRHPVVTKVVGFKSRRDRALTIADLLAVHPGTAKFKIVEKSEMPNERSFERPFQDREELRTFFGFRDAQVPSLIRFQVDSHQEIPHEIQTAQDFAKFVRRHHDADFAFVSELNGRSIPAYDGFTMKRESSEPLENVSLKYNTIKATSQKIGNLEHELGLQLKKYLTKEELLEPGEWLTVVNHLVEGERAHFDYDGWIQRAAKVGTLFGLPRIDGTGRTVARPTTIVMDIRHHGYDLQFFKQPEVQRALRAAIKHHVPSARLTVTYLWNDRQGVEVTATGVKIYE